METTTKIMDHSTAITNYQNIEEIYIKEEPLEETSLNYELYENVLQSAKKEECIYDNNNQIDKACDTLNTRNNDTNSNLEEIYIKGEPLEETSLDCELDGNVLQNVKKEECISDNDSEIDKACGNPITTNDIRKSKNTNSNSFCCTICKKSFTRKDSLIRHIKRTHEIKGKCTICNEQFTCKKYLSIHIKSHNEVKDYQCPTCYKSFTRNSSLKEHMMIHNGIIKDYKCEICNKLFTQKRYLSKHIKFHTGIKAYKCLTCNKSFVLNSHLKTHMKIHTGIRAHECPTCNKSFILNSHLTRHINKIHKL